MNKLYNLFTLDNRDRLLVFLLVIDDFISLYRREIVHITKNNISE